MKKMTQFLLTAVLVASTQSLFADAEHQSTVNHSAKQNNSLEHEKSHEGGHEQNKNHEQASLVIPDTMIKASKIGIAIADAGQVSHSITTYGLINTDTNTLSHIRARYPGELKSIQVNIGDQIKKGQILAHVESSDSLQIYLITAPISGQIIQKHANQGEITSDQPLFVIADFSTLWAELRIFPQNQASIKSGQKVTLRFNNQFIQSSVAHIVPQLDTPYLIARVPFNNKLQLTPGLFIEADIASSQKSVPVRVYKTALQTLNNQQGIFVKQNDTYVFTPVETGLSDHDFIEIKHGLKPGTEYVSENSYLLLAELQKSEAGHSH